MGITGVFGRGVSPYRFHRILQAAATRITSHELWEFTLVKFNSPAEIQNQNEIKASTLTKKALNGQLVTFLY